MSRTVKKKQHKVLEAPRSPLRAPASTRDRAPAVFKRSESFAQTCRTRRRLILFVCLCLAAITISVYARTGSFAFIDNDDQAMVYENDHVRSGFANGSIGFALTSIRIYFWQPVTWLSHMLDCQIFGLNPGAHHLESAGLHALNALLLFLLLLYMTGSLWRSALVAALFAFHPLRVEAVAWVAERRELLCGLFSLLALGAYVRYAERPSSRKRFVLVMLCLWLALMSKPMAVSLPLVMLLLDYWPLRRIEQTSLRRLVIEKIPLFASAAVVAVVTLIGNAGQALSLDAVPLRVRIADAVVAYSAYLGKFAWPQGLAAFYPYTAPGTATLIVAGLLLVVLTAAAARNSRTKPYLAIGWMWYFVTLLPVVGLVRVGSSVLADRFTYLPLIGPSLALVWYFSDLLEHRPRFRAAGIVAAVIAVLALAFLSFRQTAYWHDKYAVYERTLDAAGRNESTWFSYARALAADGRIDEAVQNYREAIRLAPDHVYGHQQLALLFIGRARLEEAIPELREVARLSPDDVSALKQLGLALIQTGSGEEAAGYLRTASSLAPNDPEIRQLLGLASVLRPANAPNPPPPVPPGPTSEQAAKPAARLSWSSLSRDESLELGMVLGVILVAMLWPDWGKRGFTRCAKAIARMAKAPVRAMALAALFPMTVRLLLLPIYPIPEPVIHDEFGYLLLADTFASGRLANPPHAMPDHFESIYVLQSPTYASYYPIASGLWMAPAKLLGVSPWFAIWLGVGIMCAAFYWMLAGWMPPRWALLGALLAGARLGVLGHWMNSYWGGAVSAIGGALVFGALPRLLKAPRARYAVLLGLGMAIAGQTRPYETALVSIPVGVALLAWLLRTNTSWRLRFSQVVLPLGAVLFCTGAFLAYYNWRVTGHPLEVPYMLYQKQYGMPQSFYWQKPLPPGNSLRFPDLAATYRWQLEYYEARASWQAMATAIAEKLRVLWAFYFQPVWTLPLLALPWLWRNRRLRFLLITAAFVIVGVGMYPFFFPHYLAPICGIFMLIVIEGIRRLALWQWRDRPVGAALARGVLAATAVCLLIAPAGEHMMAGDQLVQKNTPRSRILSTLESQGGKHLIFVHYGPNHSFHYGVVYNDADFEKTPVLWARDLGAARNQELLRYYPGRTAWIFDADQPSARLQPLNPAAAQ